QPRSRATPGRRRGTGWRRRSPTRSRAPRGTPSRGTPRARAWRAGASCGGDELGGELARKTGRGNLVGDGLRVVVDAFDRDLGRVRPRSQDREGPTRVAVLRLAH